MVVERAGFADRDSEAVVIASASDANAPWPESLKP
jgi:hypothetical protein